MNQETKLTIKLKEMGVYRESGLDMPTKFLKDTLPWTIESALAWLRKKGWKYRWISYLDGYAEMMKITVTHQNKPLIIADTYPGHELEGLLECMIKIVEGER